MSCRPGESRSIFFDLLFVCFVFLFFVLFWTFNKNIYNIHLIKTKKEYTHTFYGAQVDSGESLGRVWGSHMTHLVTRPYNRYMWSQNPKRWLSRRVSVSSAYWRSRSWWGKDNRILGTTGCPPIHQPQAIRGTSSSKTSHCCAHSLQPILWVPRPNLRCPLPVQTQPVSLWE